MIAIAGYLPAIQNGFTNWDDTAYLHNNPHMVAADGLSRIWTTGESPQYYPLTFTSFWLEHQLWGFDPLGYHVVNIVLHGINAALVVMMLTTLGTSAPAAFVVALFFAISPIQVMSVAWVAERKNTLSTVFGLLSLIGCWRWAQNGRTAVYVGTLVAFALALLSKTAWVALPIIAVAGWRLVFRLSWWRTLTASLPLVGLAVAAAMITWKMEAQFTPSSRPGAAERVLIATGALVTYVRHALVPLALYPFYPKWDVSPVRLLAWCPLVVLLCAGALIIVFRRRIPAIATWGIITFVAFLLPVLGFVPFANMDLTWISDHFAYDAVIGLYAAVVALAAPLICRLKPTRPERFAVALCAVLAVPCVAITWRDISVWKDARSMWSRAAERNPQSTVPIAGLAAAHIDSGDLDAAIREFERLRAIDPDDAHARAQLGWLLVRVGRPDHVDARLHLGAQAESRGDLAGAITQYQRALALDESDVVAASALAGALIRANQLDDAQRVIDRALAHHADAPSLLHRKGALLDARGRPEEAETLFRRALAARPNDPEIHYALGAVLARQGRRDDAIRSYQRAIELNPTVARYWNNLGTALLENQQFEAAIDRFRRALQLDPQDAVAWNNLGAALAGIGQFDDAVDALQKAVAISPDYVNARHRLGRTLADAGRYAEAVRSLEGSIEDLASTLALGMMNDVARLLAACPDASVRDPSRALVLAQRVSTQTGGVSWEAQDTLAIALAANGQFERAAEIAERAETLARTANAAAALNGLQQRRDAFRRREAYVGR